jgi:hypothetical protein
MKDEGSKRFVWTRREDVIVLDEHGQPVPEDAERYARIQATNPPLPRSARATGGTARGHDTRR